MRSQLQLASVDSVVDFFLQLSSRDEDHHVLPLKKFAHNHTGPEIVSQLPTFCAIELDKPDQVNYHNILDVGCCL